MDQHIRVRFAPSPTGPFHIGGARSALFNWLLAKKTGGTFVLRIEDTDLERSAPMWEENIKEALRWLGIDWDEGIDKGGAYGPYRQTERLDIYRRYTDTLLVAGKAYYCYCTEEELEAERQQLMARGEMPRYLGRCRNLTPQEQARCRAEGRTPAIRFKVPEHETIRFYDLVRGEVSFDSDGIGDFVIVKSDGIPVYNYAVVIDDALMRITHVIRGEEHLSNTPRQLLLYDALEFTPPAFAHISLILGKDRTKMSKRHGATSVEHYKNQGYLPEALVNFLALLGWAPEGEQEIFPLDELVRQFSLDRVAKNPAVFDIDKLNWINGHYLRHSDPGRITDLAIPHLRAAGYIAGEITPERYAWLKEVVAALREYLSYVGQITEHADIFFNDDPEFEGDTARMLLQEPETLTVMDAFRQRLAAMPVVDAAGVQGMLRQLTKDLKLGGKKVYMPIRVALTGKTHGLELPTLIPLLGKERALARVARMLAKI